MHCFANSTDHSIDHPGCCTLQSCPALDPALLLSLNLTNPERRTGKRVFHRLLELTRATRAEVSGSSSHMGSVSIRHPPEIRPQSVLYSLLFLVKTDHSSMKSYQKILSGFFTIVVTFWYLPVTVVNCPILDTHLKV